MKFHKKGQVDDLFDFLFFIAMALVLLLFLGVFIKDSQDTAKEKSLGRLSGFRFAEARLASLSTVARMEANVAKVEERRAQLDSLTKDDCADYLTKLDCREDFQNLKTIPPFHTCVWDESAGVCV